MQRGSIITSVRVLEEKKDGGDKHKREREASS